MDHDASDHEARVAGLRALRRGIGIDNAEAVVFEIDEQVRSAHSAAGSSTQNDERDAAYASGVLAALEWVLGYGTELPM